MARSLFCKEKVALSALLLLLPIFIAQAQTGTDKITYSCRATRLETVIDVLSKQTGYDFIYSRSLVDVSKAVSINVKEKSLQEVLGQIERQANVTFKLKDRHIIVKGNAKPSVVTPETIVARHSVGSMELPRLKINDGPLLTSTNRSFRLRPIESEATILENRLDKRIGELQSLLGPNVPRSIPQYYISQMNFNNRHRNVYVAVGSYVNDKSAGIELQAGLPYAYAVFHPMWSATKGFNPSYGVGNSFNLTGNFTFNTIYMYSSYSKTETVYSLAAPREQAGPELRQAENERQHEIKFLVQYSFSKTLSVRVGPVLNYRSVQTQLSFVSPNMPETMTINHPYGSVGYQTSKFSSTTKTTRYTESWVGWDASVIYRINFYEHR
jgi:hypothetical protein